MAQREREGGREREREGGREREGKGERQRERDREREKKENSSTQHCFHWDLITFLSLTLWGLSFHFVRIGLLQKQTVTGKEA